MLEEYIELGQRIQSFSIEVWDGMKYQEVIAGTTIGKKRILQFAIQNSSKLRLTITGSKASPVIGEISLYHAAVY